MHSEPVLRRLTVNDEAELLRAHRATTPEVPNFLHFHEEGMTIGRYIEVLSDRERGIGFPTPEYVPTTFLCAFVGPRIVGRVSIRHRLNARLEREGGHIGYVVVPEFRRRGYATAMLRNALEILRTEHGLRRALVTCDDDNFGSIRVIERNGGVLENTVSAPELEKPVRRYWIDIGNSDAAASS